MRKPIVETEIIAKALQECRLINLAYDAVAMEYGEKISSTDKEPEKNYQHGTLSYRLATSDRQAATLVNQYIAANKDKLGISGDIEIRHTHINAFRRRNGIGTANPQESGWGGARTRNINMRRSLSTAGKDGDWLIHCSDGELLELLRNAMPKAEISPKNIQKWREKIGKMDTQAEDNKIKQMDPQAIGRMLIHLESYQTIAPNYNSPDILDGLHYLDVGQLSKSCIGQGLTGDPPQISAKYIELRDLNRKLKSREYADKHEAMRQRAKEIAQEIGYTDSTTVADGEDTQSYPTTKKSVNNNQAWQGVNGQ